MKRLGKTIFSPVILYEDVHLIVLSKPAGLLSQADESREPNLVDWLRDYLGRHYVGLTHRLDRNTSGIMLIAKRTKSARRLTEALQSGQIRRIYLAFLEGNLPGPQTWRHLLYKDASKNKVIIRDVRGQKNSSLSSKSLSKEAVLRVSPVEHIRRKGKVFTLAEFELQTGRSHQIRAQAAHEGFPVVGDRKYGSFGVGREDRGQLDRPLLHSYHLTFPHPKSGEILQFTAPLPDDMIHGSGFFKAAERLPMYKSNTPSKKEKP